MTSGVRLCKDCRWVTWPWHHIRDSSGAICTHPSIIEPPAKPDLVTGHKVTAPSGTFCDMERDYGQCGPEGKHWERKSHE